MGNTMKTASQVAPPDRLIVRLKQGTYLGTTVNSVRDQVRSLPTDNESGITTEDTATSTRYPRPVEAWLGVPYAETTAGENRFRLPVRLGSAETGSIGGGVTSSKSSSSSAVAVAASGGNVQENNETDKWVHISKADRLGPLCPGTKQEETEELELVEGEDCLRCNIFRPGRGDDEMKLLPVVVYIHGGAFNGGFAMERDMGSFVAWAAITGDGAGTDGVEVMGVSFEYRVGALGFLPCGLTAKEGVLNLGLRDQQLLLEWVSENIEAFGGDPGNVTLMAYSAGAHSIGHHLLSYPTPESAATAPFHKAILESGSSLARATYYADDERHEAQFRELLAAASVPIDTPPAEVLPLLRTLPVEAVVAASRSVFDRYQVPIRWPFQPAIELDGDKNVTSTSSKITPHEAQPESFPPLLTTTPIAQWRANAHIHIPILTGFNTHEGSIFTPPPIDTDTQFSNYFRAMIPTLQSDDLAKLESTYPDPNNKSNHAQNLYAPLPAGFGRQWPRLLEAYGHYGYICPVVMTAAFMAASLTKGGSKEESKPPVWLYRFDARSHPTWRLANHGDEGRVVAHDMAHIGSCKGLAEVADAMCSAWARFAAFGDPNGSLANQDTTTSSSMRGDEVEGHRKKMPFWPRFSSPLPLPVEGQAEADGRMQEQQDEMMADSGKLMLFGKGNDELAGGSGKGTPAQVAGLSDFDIEQCRYWWDRIDLSQGYGKRAEGGTSEL